MPSENANLGPIEELQALLWEEILRQDDEDAEWSRFAAQRGYTDLGNPVRAEWRRRARHALGERENPDWEPTSADDYRLMNRANGSHPNRLKRRSPFRWVLRLFGRREQTR